MGGKGVRERRSTANLFVDGVEDGFEEGVREARPQDIERLHQGHAGLQQRRQFLVEYEEFVTGNLAPAAERQTRPGEPGLQGEDVETFALELSAKRSLALGDVHALNDFTRRGGKAAAELHP